MSEFLFFYFLKVRFGSWVGFCVCWDEVNIERKDFEEKWDYSVFFKEMSSL